MQLVIDFSDPKQKHQFISRIRELTKVHKVEIVQWRPKRSNPQNSYYHAVVVDLFLDYANGLGNNFTAQEAHDALRFMFLRKTMVNKETGEILGETVRSTTELTTVEFNEYLQQCSAYLAESCGVIVPEPTAQ